LDKEGQGTQPDLEVKVTHLGQTGPLGSYRDEKSKNRDRERLSNVYTLKKAVTCSSKTLVFIYQTTWCHIPDHHYLYFH
jgi:hypothetical protein